MKLFFLLIGLVSFAAFPSGESSDKGDATLTFEYTDGSQESFTIDGDLVFSTDPVEFDKLATKSVVICTFSWGSGGPNSCTGSGGNCAAASSRFSACNCEMGITYFCNNKLSIR
jgi:hypothetical protein